MPQITDPVAIDGTTQTGFTGTPVIVLDGVGTTGIVHGLDVTAGNSTIKGLVIKRFPRNGILLQTGGGNVVRGNYLGIDAGVDGGAGRRC